MKKVLIALDYDPTADKIAETGYKLAKTMRAKTTLLHIMSDQVYYYSPEYSPMGLAGAMVTYPLRKDSGDELKKAAQDFLDKTKVHVGDDTIDTLVKVGRVSETILETAKDLEVDIIVMGSHSRKWLEKIVMGSATESVLNKTSIPLFIVPTKNKS